MNNYIGMIDVYFGNEYTNKRSISSGRLGNYIIGNYIIYIILLGN